MTNLLVCPSCGRSTAVDAATSGRVSCAGCGRSLTRFLRAEYPTSPPPMPEPIARAAPTPPPTTMLPPPRRAPQRRAAPAAVAVTLAAAAAVAGLAGGYALHRPAGPSVTELAEASWEQEHRGEIDQLKVDAESHVLAGDLTGGHERYRRLQQLVGSHTIQDPALADLVRSAQASQDRVYDILLARQAAAPHGDGVVPPETPTAVARAEEAASRPAGPTADAPPLVAPPIAPVVDATPANPTPIPTEPASTTAIAPAVSPSLPPAVPMAVVLPGRLADQRVGEALDRGVAYLIGRFRGGQIVDGLASDDMMHQGLDALCVYALAHAAEASKNPQLDPHGPFMSGLIQSLKGFPMASDPAKPGSPVVYARSLRAAALAVFYRPEDRAALRADVAWLVAATSGGSYTYDDRYAAGLHPPSMASAGGGGAPLPAPGQSPTGGQPSADSAPPGYRYVYVPGNPGPPLMGPNGRPIIDHCTPSGHFIYNHPVQPHMALVPIPQAPATTPGTGLDAPLQSDTPTAPPPGAAQPAAPPSTSLGGPPPWDNSNSQYGLLGVWAGAEAGVEVPQAYWKAVEGHWLSCELRDGTWFYSNADTRPRLSMTCAGVASLLVTHEWLDLAALGKRVGRPPYSPALTAGLAWLETGDNVLGVISPDTFYVGYSAYGVERCALASGFKFFGTHDWFAELSAQLLTYQFPVGSWGSKPEGTDALVNTAYMVLFLSRGRHPVLMNKLRMDPYWDNRPSDMANLTTFAGRELERPFNWQVVSFARPWSDWMDAPVLYVASHAQPHLSADDEAKLKAYADAGGLIFTHADSNSASFSAWADALAKRLWPDLGGLKPLPEDHPIYSVVLPLHRRPKLLAVSNGSRLLMVHSPTDLSATWQDRPIKGNSETFGMGLNLFVWAAGKSNFRRRLDTPFIPDPPPATAATTAVARLRYDGGNWDPEPYAWTRFARFYQWTTGGPVTVSPVDLAALAPGQAPVAVLTGATAVTFTDAQVAAVRAYVTAGGTLLVDACGGSPAFAASAESLLGKAFPGVPLTALADADPVLKGAGTDDLTRPVLRGYATERLNVPLGSPGPRPRGLTAGTGRVVYSPLDLTTGLLDTNPWGIVGYAPLYAQAIVEHVLLTAAH